MAEIISLSSSDKNQNNNTCPPKVKGKSFTHNFFFHPSKCGKYKALSIITNIALTILSVGLWQIPFWVVNQLDKNKVTSKVKKDPSAENPVNATISLNNPVPPKSNVVNSTPNNISINNSNPKPKVDPYKNLPNGMRKKIAAHPKREEVTEYVQRFMFPYLSGEITRENEDKNRLPLIELIYKDVLHEGASHGVTVNAEEAEVIQEIAFQTFLMEAVKVYIRLNNGRVLKKTPRSDLKQIIIPEVKRVMNKDFPGCKMYGNLSSRINASFKIYKEQEEVIKKETDEIFDKMQRSDGLSKSKTLISLSQQNVLFTADLV